MRRLAFIAALCGLGRAAKAQSVTALGNRRIANYTAGGAADTFAVNADTVLVFRNGVFQTPGIDYTITGGAVTMLPNCLNTGDLVSVVEL